MNSAERLVGCWHLESFRQYDAELGWEDALGPDAQGYINYWPSGTMSVLIGGSVRPRFRGAWERIADRDKAAALDGLVAYAGRYSLRGNHVIHHVEICWIPNWEGRELVRALTFLGGDRMVLKTVPPESGRRSQQQEVVWSRVSAPQL